jgi:hypothetical protein
MVLQRDQEVPVWGWDEPGAEITVEFAGQKKTAKVAADGKWLVRLNSMKASAEPQSLLVSSPIGNQKSAMSWLAKSGFAPGSRTWLSRFQKPRILTRSR